MTSSKDPAKKPPSKTTMLVPVTVALLVPIEVEGEVDPEHTAPGIGDTPSFDAEHIGQYEDMILDALRQCSKQGPVSDALGALMAGAQLYQRDYPGTRGWYTHSLGIIAETEF